MHNTYTKENYQEFLEYLFSIEDIPYKKFHRNLFKEDIHLIGIRTPELKRIAKEISKNDYDSFIVQNTHTYYEEKVIHGFILGFIKKKFPVLLQYIEDFLPFCDNWAINDLTCAALKEFKKKENQKEGFTFIQKLLKEKDPTKIRFGLILLLDHYMNDEYIDTILTIIEKVNYDEYYVKMANAWLLSLCFIKYREKTWNYLQSCSLDKWTFNKTISKICDSYRVSKEDKEMLKNFKKERNR